MKKLLWLILLVVLVIGCAGEKNYFPLTVGNEWEYDITHTLTTTYPDTVIQHTGTSVTEITMETTLDNGTEVFEQVTTTTWDDTTAMSNSIDTTYIEEADDYILIYDNKADIVPDTSLALPIEEGNTWIVNVVATDTLFAEVIGKESVTIPAGTYEDCWKIEYTSIGLTQHDWFAPDIGIVKYHMVDDHITDTNEYTKDLVSVTIQ